MTRLFTLAATLMDCDVLQAQDSSKTISAEAAQASCFMMGKLHFTGRKDFPPPRRRDAEKYLLRVQRTPFGGLHSSPSASAAKPSLRAKDFLPRGRRESTPLRARRTLLL